VTIDSSYFPETYKADADDLFYSWTFESIGADTVEVTLTLSDGTRLTPVPTDYLLRLGGFGPLFQRGELEVTVSGGYPDAVEINFGRNTPITQELDLIEGEPFPAEAYEAAGDKLTLICQELKGEKCDCFWGGTRESPNSPSVPPSNLPECQPYSCSAYEDYLIENDIEYWNTYSVIPADFPYPFATAESQAGSKLLVYGNYVAAPALISDWNGPASGSDGTFVRFSTNASSTANPPDFCDGTIDSIVCFDGSGGAGNANGVIVRGTRPIANEIKAPFGDYTVSALICGYNFTNNIAVGGSDDWFVEGINKIWRFRRNGTDYRVGQSASLGVKITTIGATNDVRVTLQIESPVNDGYPDLVIDTFDVSNVANILTPISATVESSQPYEAVVGGANPNTGKYGVFIDITVTCAYGGTSLTVTNSQALNVGFTAGSNPITNLGTEKPRLYEQARCCWNGVLSFASLTWDDAVSADFVNELEIAYDRNFSDYTPPGYC